MGTKQYPHMNYRLLKNPHMDIKQIIAANIAALRRQADGSMETLKSMAKRSGLSFSTIQRASRGEINITIENLETLARAYRKTPCDLLRMPDDGNAGLPSPLSGYLLPSPNGKTAPIAAESPTSYGWPFEFVRREAYEALPPQGRAFVQGALQTAIDNATQQFTSQTRKLSA